MTYANVEVPIKLLRDTRLTPADKLVWLIMRLDSYNFHGRKLASPTRLSERTRLSRCTIPHSLQRLAAAGWYVAYRPIRNQTQRCDKIDLPANLIRSADLRPRDIVIYGLLKEGPMHRWNGRCTYQALSRYSQMSLKTVRKAVQALVAAGWLKMEQASPYTPIRYQPANPLDAYRLEIQRRIDTYRNHGEAIAREMAIFPLQQASFQVGARQSWLTNPKTGALMETDLYVHDYRFAMEFHGEQHFHETEFASAEAVARQQARDAEKERIMRELKMKFLVLTAEDLSLKVVREKLIELDLPLRDLEGLEPIISFLDGLGRDYRRQAQRRQEEREMQQRAAEWAKAQAAQEESQPQARATEQP